MIVSKDDLKTFITHPSSSNDDLFDLILSMVQGRAEEYCGRRFDYAENIEEQYNGNGVRDSITVERFPINKAKSVKLWDDQDQDFLDAEVLELNNEYFVDWRTGEMRLLGFSFSDGVQNIKVKYSGGYKVIGGTDGAVVEAELKSALLAQAAHLFQRRNDLGIKAVSIAGQTVSQMVGFELLPDVEKILDGFRRLTF